VGDGHDAASIVMGEPSRTARFWRRAGRDTRLAEALVLGVMLAWAGNFIVVKAAVGVVPPIAFALVRFALAAVALLLITRWREGSIGLPRRDWLTMAVLGFLGFGLYQMLWPTALTLIPAGDAAIIGSITPLLTAFLAVAAGSDTLSPAKVAGGLLALAGVGIVIAAGSGFTLGSSVVGDLLILASATSWAVYAAFGAPFLRRHSPLRTTAWAMFFGSVALLPLGIYQMQDVDPAVIGPGIVAALAYSGLLSAGIANVVVLNGVRLLGPTRITNFQYIIPFAAVILAFVFLGEPIRVAQLAGGAVIVAGIVLARREKLVPGRVRRFLTA
jgi:drug/metabolite transporter (DMT)-like permease